MLLGVYKCKVRFFLGWIIKYDVILEIFSKDVSWFLQLRMIFYLEIRLIGR